MADSTIPTNSGAGGPSLDAETAYQEDGATLAYRERVQVTFDADDPRGRVVSRSQPLPAEGEESVRLLAQIAGDIREIKTLLVMLAGT